MKSRISEGLITILLLLLVSCTQSATTTEIPATPSPQALAEQGFVSPDLPRITCEELKQKMDKGESLILVDAEKKDTFARGHLPGSINIPRYDPEETVNAELQKLPRDGLIVFYCG